MKKHPALSLLASVLCLVMTVSCSKETPAPEAKPITPTDTAAVPAVNRTSSEETWAIYWYLCGSDLESNYGCATSDLSEMMEVTLPENVQVVIETGGAVQWQNDFIEAGKTQRYLYDSEGLNLVDEQPEANMGDPNTLTSFLSFCAENYPADHTMIVFWNHGGGSVGGAAFDENYGFDSLTLDEMYDAFTSVYDLSTEAPPFEIVGFDTCLMATVDVAYTFCDVGRYLVASQELEPGNGWHYSGWVQALASDPGMDGATLGQAICDAYVEGCELNNTADEITLSVIDLGQLKPLMDAYEQIGQEALAAAAADPSFFSTLGRAASRSENYGGNTPDEGYTNMVDLGHLARNSTSILPENAQAVQDALDNCVVYKVNGPYRTEATGLSCYYSYNGDMDDFMGYTTVGASDSFKYLYSYELEGALSETGMEYLSEIGYESDTLPEVPVLDSTSQEDYPVTVDDEGYAVLDLGAETANLLKGVYFQLAYMDEESDLMLLLGRDNDIDMDWENGIFKDNFRGVWGAIDGNLVYMELVYEGEDYNTYSVPILLNGEEYNLRVVYDYNDECYYILGARKGLEDTGMADKNLVQLQVGDKITSIHYVSSISGDDDFVPSEVDTFSVTADTSFEEVDLGDGEFMMMFELVDIRNESTYSQAVFFTVEQDEIYTEA